LKNFFIYSIKLNSTIEYNVAVSCGPNE
jgi:hypothetical protein